MNELSLKPIDGLAFDPGSTAEVEASWNFDDPPEALELRLIWSTSGKGDSDLKVVSIERIDAPSLGETRRMKVEIPDEPYSFSGKLISLTWALELIAQPTSKGSTRMEIVVAPNGEEVKLPQSNE